MKRICSMAGAVLVGSLALSGIAAPAAAQQAPPGAEAAPSQAVSDAEVDRFAKAIAKVESIRTAVEEKMQQPGAASEAGPLREAATSEMMKAVEGEGLSVERFNAISLGAQQDPELRTRIVARLQKPAGEGPPAPTRAD